MKKHLIHFLLVAVLSICSAAAFAQTTVKGQLVDSETGEPLVGAAVMVEGTSQGTVTDIDGYFKQGVAQGGTLVFKYVGFKDLKKKITQKGASVDLGVIKMDPDAVMLADVTITSSIAVARKTPVAVSTIDPVFIEEKLGTQEFPEILKSTPGIYATKDGGGFGDSKVPGLHDARRTPRTRRRHVLQHCPGYRHARSRGHQHGPCPEYAEHHHDA